MNFPTRLKNALYEMVGVEPPMTAPLVGIRGDQVRVWYGRGTFDYIVILRYSSDEYYHVADMREPARCGSVEYSTASAALNGAYQWAQSRMAGTSARTKSIDGEMAEAFAAFKRGEQR